MRVPRPDPSSAAWRSSSYSNANRSECVEVSGDFLGFVPVRDSKNPGAALVIPTAAWRAFVDHVKR
jgi:hypothetical protein